MVTLNKIPFSYLFSGMRRDLLVVGIVTLMISLVARLPQVDVVMPIAIPSVLGTGITLILSFKLNQSYDRWWEARKIWGAIVNDSRSLVVQLLSFTQGKQGERVQRMAYRQIAWCYTLAMQLRQLEADEHTHDLLSEEDRAYARAQQNQALALLNLGQREVVKLLNKGRINAFQQVQIDATFVRLMASQGKAERIKGTHFPKTYRAVLHLFLYIFIFALAIAISEMAYYQAVPIVLLVALPLFLLEKVARRIQDPFENKPSDTAMLTISRTIEINIRQLLGESEIPPPFPPGKFYRM